MIASTGQGISLMQEALAEMSNAEIPCVVVNMMRGQSDYYPGHARRRTWRLPPPRARAAHGAGGGRSDRRSRSTSATSGARRSTSWATSCSATRPRPSQFRPRDERDLPPKTWAATGARGRRAHNVTPLGSPEKLHLRARRALRRSWARSTRAWRGRDALRDRPARRCRGGGRRVRLAGPRSSSTPSGSAGRRGLKVGWMRPITLWPFPDEVVADVAEPRAHGRRLRAERRADDRRRAPRGRSAARRVVADRRHQPRPLGLRRRTAAGARQHHRVASPTCTTRKAAA